MAAGGDGTTCARRPDRGGDPDARSEAGRPGTGRSASEPSLLHRLAWQHANPRQPGGAADRARSGRPCGAHSRTDRSGAGRTIAGRDRGGHGGPNGAGALSRHPTVNARVAAVVLAAGTSSRMSGSIKLLCEIDGVPMIERAVRAALASRCAQVVVVTGCQADRIEAAVASDPVTLVRNPDYAEGLAASLRCGVASLPPDVDAALIQLADMPWVGAQHIDRLIDA